MVYFWGINTFKVELPKYVMGIGKLVKLIGMTYIVVAVIQFRVFLSPFPSPKKNQQLITKGIFSLSRHPIYTGIFLYFIGKATEKASIFAFAIGVVFLVFVYFKASYEEALLSEKFTFYSSYQKKTRMFF